MEAVATEIDVAQVIEDLGFPPATEIGTVHSVAHLFGKSKPRCGIYLLGFSDGLFYIGQARDAAKRFVQHRRRHDNIRWFSFQKCRRNQLNDTEIFLIHQAEDKGLLLTNKVHVATVIGETDLDQLLSPQEQKSWLSDPLVFNRNDPTKRIEIDKAQRLRYRANFDRFQTLPEADAIASVLRTFAERCLPAYRRTEYSFWELSCMPSTKSGGGQRVACMNANVMELLVVGVGQDINDKSNGFMNVSINALDELFDGPEEFYASHPETECQESFYQAAGNDQVTVNFGDLDALRGLLDDGRVCQAAGVLNLRLMRKGPTVYSRFHCIDLADRIFSE